LPDSSRMSIRPRGAVEATSVEVARSKCKMINSAVLGGFE
jgi:hypothetical protein